MNQREKSRSIFAKRSIFGRSASEQGMESTGCQEGTLSSPVTNLTFNLQVLSTHGAEPKFVRRKLSLTSSSSFSEGSENVRSPFLQRQFSADDGCCIDSPGSDGHESMSYDSPFLQNWEAPLHPLEPKCQSRASGFKRFNSVPAFDIPNSSSLRTTFSLTSVKEVDSSHGIENMMALKRGDENKENEGIAAGDSGCKKSVSFKLPTSPAPRGIIISPFKDDTNSPTVIGRRTQCPGGNVVGQTNLDLLRYKSPKMSAKAYSRQLHRTLSRKLSSDDGFLEKLQDDGDSSDRQAVPKGLEGLFFSPVLEASESESSPATHDQLPDKATFSGDAMDGQESGIARGLFRSPSAPKLIRRKYSAQDIRISYKRSESHNQDSDLTPLQLKRWKGGLAKEGEDGEEKEDSGGSGVDEKRIAPRRRIMRCHSETEIFIKTALSWADSQQNLIGDFTKPFCLPLVNGKHQDLKAISPATMAAIVNNHYKDVMEDCIVVDCRYPYEFNGGHIPGARNVYTTDDLIEMFFNGSRESDPAVSSASTSSSASFSSSPSGSTEKRNIVIFHCEFSSERGPKLSRFLRNHDRDANIDSYPALRYPEIYVLEGGYKAFYESFPHLCEPLGYVPMLHQDHLIELKQFRSKSSSWATAGDKGRVVGRKMMHRPSLNL